MNVNTICKIGDSVRCPSGEMCAGNQCCSDGTTCPSANNNYNACRLGKSQDCTITPTPPTRNFVCPSKQCCEVGKSQQCCAMPDPAGSGRCSQLGELCDVIYRTQPNRCGQTADGKIICDCEGGKLPPINPSCCEKAGGKRGREGKCIFNNMLQCARARLEICCRKSRTGSSKAARTGRRDRSGATGLLEPRTQESADRYQRNAP